jgi:hypothetical protein
MLFGRVTWTVRRPSSWLSAGGTGLVDEDGDFFNHRTKEHLVIADLRVRTRAESVRLVGNSAPVGALPQSVLAREIAGW